MAFLQSSKPLEYQGGGSFLPPPRVNQVYAIFEKGKFFELFMSFQIEASNNP